MAALDIDDSVREFSTGVKKDKDFLLYESGNKMFAVENTWFRRVQKFFLDGWTRSYDYKKICQDLMQYSLQPVSEKQKQLSTDFYSKVQAKYERYSAKRAGSLQTAKVAAKALTKERPAEAKVEAAKKGAIEPKKTEFAQVKGGEIVAQPHARREIDLDIAWLGVTKRLQLLDKTEKSFDEIQAKYDAIQQKLGQFKTTLPEAQVFARPILFHELRDLYLKIINTQLKKHLPQLPEAAIQPRVPKVSVFSPDKITATSKLLLDIIGLEDTDRLKPELKECVIFVLANCKDLLEQMKNEKLQAEAIDALKSRLVRYSKALQKFPQIIANLNQNIMAQMSVRIELPIERKELLIIFGDSFLKHSGLEGDTGSAKYVEIAKKFLESLNLPLAHPKLPQILDAAVDLRKPGVDIEASVKKALKANGKCLLMGGWKGHAVTYSIEKDKVCIFNAGDGVQFHPSAEVGLKKKVQPFIEITDVNPDVLFEGGWLKQIQALTELSGPKYNLQPAEILYQQLIPLLGGKVSPPRSDLNSYMTPQRSGTCTWKCLFAFLAKEMGKKDAKVFKFRLKSAVLANYAAYLQQKVQTGQELTKDDITGLQAAKTKFSSGIAKVQASDTLSKLIPHDEIAAAHSLVEQIEGFIAEVSAKKIIQEREHDTRVSELQHLKDPQFNRSLHAPIKLPQVSPEAVYNEPPPGIYIPLQNQLLHWKPKPQTIRKDIASFAQLVKDARRANKYKEVVHFCDHFVQKMLQSDPAHALLWSQVTPAEARQLLQELTTISHQARNCLTKGTETGNLDETYHLREINVTTNMYLLGCMQALASQLPHNETLLYTISPDVQLHAMVIPKSNLSRLSENVGPSIFENSSFRETNPESSRYHAAIAKQYSKPTSALFQDAVIDTQEEIASFNLQRTAPQFYQAIQRWLQTKENYDRVKAVIDPVLVKSGKTFDALAENERIETVASQFQTHLPEPFRLLREQAHFLQRCCNKSSPKLFNGERMEKSPLCGVGFKRKGCHYRHLMFAATFPPFKNEALELLSHLLLSSRMPENEILIDPQGLAKYIQIPTEEYRALLSIRSEREFQIPLTLDYFSEHIPRLKERDYQNILMMLLFEGSVLSDDLQASPHRAKKISEFLQNAYSLFESQNDAETCAFLIQLASSLRDYSDSKIAPWDDAAKVHEAIKKFEKVPSSEKKQRELGALHATRLSMNAYRLSKKGALPSKAHLIDLLQSRQFLLQYPLDAAYKNTRQDMAIEETLYLLKGHLQPLVKTIKDRNSILNSTLSSVKGGAPCTYKWKADPSYPVFLTHDGAFRFNIETGDIVSLKEEGIPQPIPEQVRTHSSFSDVFGERAKVLTCKVLNKSLIEINDNGIIYRVRQIQVPKDDVIIFAKFGAPPEWCQYTPSTIANINQAPSAIVNEHYGKWTSIAGDPDDKTVYYVDRATKKPHYILQEGQMYKVMGGRETASDVELLTLREPLPEPFKLLEHFELPKYIHVLHHEKTNKMEIELPRFHLHFECTTTEKPSKWLSREHPGYFLSPVQVVESLGNVSGIFVLENADGKKKVLIPNQDIAPKKEASLDFPVSFVQEKGEEKRVKETYLEYSLDAEGALIPANIAARFHLATLHLAQSHYKEASRLTLAATAEIQEREYTNDETTCLSRLAATRRHGDSVDQWGEAVAVRLHARYLLEKHRQVMGSPDLAQKELKEEFDTYRSELELYYNQFNNTGSVRLQSYEEELLLKRCIKLAQNFGELLPGAIQNRSQELELLPFIDVPAALVERVALFDATLPNPDTICKNAPLEGFYNDLMGWRGVKMTGEIPPLFFEDAHKFVLWFPALYGKVKMASTEEEKRNLFIQLCPLYRSQAGVCQTGAAILIAMLFSPECFPETYFEFREGCREAYQTKKATTVGDWLSDSLSGVNIEAAKKWLNKAESTLIPVASKSAKIKTKEVAPKAAIEMAPLPSLVSRLSLVSSIDTYFTKKIETQSEKAAIQHTMSDIFSPANPEAAQETMVKKAYETMQKDVARFLDHHEVNYRIKNNQLDTLLSLLQTEKEAANDALQFQEAEILFHANKVSGNTAIRAEFSSGKRTYPSMQELFVYFGQGDFQGLKERNPALTNEDIEKIRDLLCLHLIEKTRDEKIGRTLTLATSLKAIPEGPEREEVEQSLALELKAERAYDPHQYPAFLVFECLSNLLIRKDQVDDMKLFLEEKVLPARQKIMGGGKTTVLSPLLALLLADGKRTSMMTVPKSLLSAVAGIFRTTLGAGFSEPFCVISFHRNHLTDAYLKKVGKTRVEYLQDLLSMLKNGQRNSMKGVRQIAVVTPEVRHSLINAFEEALAFPEKMDPQSIEFLREISIHVKTNVVEIIDEIDQVLSPRLEFNYSLGEKKQYDQRKGKLVARLTEAACTLPFTPADYAIKTKNGVANLLLDNLLFDQHIVGAELAAANKQEISRLDPKQKELLKWYLLGTTETKETLQRIQNELHLSEKSVAYAEALLRQNPNTDLREVEGLIPEQRQQLRSILQKKIALDKEISAAVQQLSPLLRELLATATCVFNTILPTSLSKVCNEQYGHRKDPMNLIACPFAAANSPKTTEYGTPEEQIVYSIQALHASGISDQLTLDYTKKLHEQALNQAKFHKVHIEKTAAFREFDRLRGPHKKITFATLSEDTVQTITKHINKSPELLMFFSDSYLIPKIMIYPSKISSNPYKLAMSSKAQGGFTGTLEPSLLPPGMTPKAEEGTTAKTVVGILRKVQNGTSSVATMREAERPLSEQLLHAMAMAETYHALIDSGGWLKDVKIPEFARKLLETAARPSIKGVVFHDERGQLVCLEKTAEGIVVRRLAESSLKEEERITIIAQLYCTGTNVKQTATAKALKTTGKSETLRDFLQSAFRMRGILKKQNVDMVVSDEVAATIRATLQLKKTDPIDYATLLRFYATSQCYRVADDNLLAMREKMPALIQDVIKRQLLHPANKTEYQKIFTKARELFVQAEPEELYPAFASMASFVTKEQKIANTIEAHLKAILPHLTTKEICLDVIESAKRARSGHVSEAELQGKPLEAYRSMAINALRAVLASQVDKDALRDVLPATSGDFGREVEREQERESEVEKEQQKEAEKELEKEALEEAEGSMKTVVRSWPQLNQSGLPNLLKWRDNFGIVAATPDQIPPTNVFSQLKDMLQLVGKPEERAKLSKVAAALNPHLSYSLNFIGFTVPTDKSVLGAYEKNIHKRGQQILVIQEEGKPTRIQLVSSEEADAIQESECPTSYLLYEPDYGTHSYEPGHGARSSGGDCKNYDELFKQLIQYCRSRLGSAEFGPKFEAFEKTQKQGYQVLIIQEAGKPTRTQLISLKEAADVKKAILALSDVEKAKLHQDTVTFSLYDPVGGIDVSSGTAADPEKDEELFEELVQIKFLNGSLNYDPKEVDYLRSWLEKNDPQQLYDFFLNKVLAYKLETKKAFLAESFLKTLFDDIIKKLPHVMGNEPD